LGSIESLEKDKKPVKQALKSTGGVAIRIKGDKHIMFGRHFQLTDNLTSIVRFYFIKKLDDEKIDRLFKGVL